MENIFDLAFSVSPRDTWCACSSPLYLRVFTEEQRERQSIATQRDFAERYCALHRLTVVAIYADDGVSGTGRYPHSKCLGALVCAGSPQLAPKKRIVVQYGYLKTLPREYQGPRH